MLPKNNPCECPLKREHFSEDDTFCWGKMDLFVEKDLLVRPAEDTQIDSSRLYTKSGKTEN